MKYGIWGVIMPLLLKKTVMGYLGDIVPEMKASDIKFEFKGIIARQPEIGGRRNNLMMRLYWAAYWTAAYKVFPQRITNEIFERLVYAPCYSDIMRKMSGGKNFFTEKNMKTRERLSKDPTFNAYPENWKYSFSYNMSVPECTIIYTRCAICEMKKREGCSRLVRYMCITDFANQELMRNQLIRTKTLGNGDDCCDYHIIGKKK